MRTLSQQKVSRAGLSQIPTKRPAHISNPSFDSRGSSTRQARLAQVSLVTSCLSAKLCQHACISDWNVLSGLAQQFIVAVKVFYWSFSRELLSVRQESSRHSHRKAWLSWTQQS